MSETLINPPISPLRRRMIEDMTVRQFVEKTQGDYIRHVRTFTAFLGRSPDTATADDLRRFQLHQAETGVRPPTINSAVAALRFFFTVTLDRPALTSARSPTEEMPIDRLRAHVEPAHRADARRQASAPSPDRRSHQLRPVRRAAQIPIAGAHDKAPVRRPAGSLYGASKVKPRSEGTVIFLHSSFLVRPGSPFLRSDPQFSAAVARRGGQGRATIARPRGLVLDGSEHDGTVGWSGRRLEGSSPFAARDQSHRDLVCGGPGDPNHDAVLRIGREAPKRQVHSSLRHDSHRIRRMPATSNRHRRHVTCARAPKAAKNSTVSVQCAGRRTRPRHDAFANEAPQRDQQLSCQSHDHLLACAACAGCPLQEPLGQCAVLLEP